MAWKFLQIGKANAEIDRLNAELSKVTKERDEAVAVLESNNSETVKQAEELQTNLAAANGKVSTLEAAVAAKDTELAAVKAELKAANDKIANPPAQIVTIASQKAAEITGAQGQPPISTQPAGTPAGTSSPKEMLAKYNAISDPMERMKFYRANRDEIDAAFRS